ncbi:hypothetical protein SDRG_06234 [Saprolegnia diclina VS20]|uniref:Arf-GAP domain-containing protein n=1 Tax=Saprolegnia diclina (strain VS20) TaxID=1156394 RepID=T0RUI5_SAPDV|nr:hypothetical protein SDRG_06234 [Saprolegnia diclina VS20]EQC36118.1 hypothetical protein SDRG_06234 [Saprolegnia diclina VS20]|eukprot:XP_008610224.1 hypothetical protein SDRG_06234 [Saprolegnia diclina VS20]
MAAGAPISPSKESSMRRVAGNDRCADCNKVFPQWSSVTFGVLLCLGCAGVHRSLGVQTSFVKSLSMDTWTARDIALLEAGGNGKWTTVCLAAGIFERPIADKYTSSVAEAYRKRMSDAAECPFSALDVLADLGIDPPASLDALCSTLPTSGRSSPVRRSSLASLDATSVAASAPVVRASSESAIRRGSLSALEASLQVKCTLCEDLVHLSHLNVHSQSCAASASVETIEFEARLGSTTSPLGLSLTKDERGDTVVSKVTPGGDADVSGVVIGARVLALNGSPMTKFDTIMQSLDVPRPIGVRFAIDRPFVAYDVILEANEVGCTFQTSLYKHVLVTSVEPDGHGAAAGVLIGSRVYQVNGEAFAIASDLLRALLKASRPLTLRLHRYDDALIRPWTSNNT